MKGAIGATGSLIQPIGLLAASAWLSHTTPPDETRLERLRLDPSRTPNVRIALGLGGFRSSHTEATHARRVATITTRPPGSITTYQQVAVQAMATVDADQAQAFVHRQLGAFAADDDTSLRLMDTLETYLDEHASRSRAAKRLGVHENAISYRIRQVEEILGRSVEDHTLDLRVALALARTGTARRDQPR